MAQLNNVAVLGSGVLGGQIAWHSAYKGKSVVVYDISSTAIDQCREAHNQYAAIYLAEVGASEQEIADTRSRLSYTTDLQVAAAGQDLVIEAVPEDPSIKSSVYRDMAPLLDPHTLIATNSSTLLPRDFAEDTGRPERYCALHFANLIWAMNVAEIMAHAGTAPETLTAITEYAIEIGMIPLLQRSRTDTSSTPGSYSCSTPGRHSSPTASRRPKTSTAATWSPTRELRAGLWGSSTWSVSTRHTASSPIGDRSQATSR